MATRTTRACTGDWQKPCTSQAVATAFSRTCRTPISCTSSRYSTRGSAAGTLKIPYRTFFLFNGLAAAIELPLLVFGVRYIGGRWKEILPAIQQAQGWLLAGVVAIVVIVVALHRMRSRAKTKLPAPR